MLSRKAQVSTATGSWMLRHNGGREKHISQLEAPIDGPEILSISGLPTNDNIVTSSPPPVTSSIPHNSLDLVFALLVAWSLPSVISVFTFSIISHVPHSPQIDSMRIACRPDVTIPDVDLASLPYHSPSGQEEDMEGYCSTMGSSNCGCLLVQHESDLCG